MECVSVKSVCTSMTSTYMVEEDTSGQIPMQSSRVPTKDQNSYTTRETRVSPFVILLPKQCQFWAYFGFLHCL